MMHDAGILGAPWWQDALVLFLLIGLWNWRDSCRWERLN
jgi:hypothetical protein